MNYLNSLSINVVFKNYLDSDQARLDFGPDQDPNC